MEKAIKKFLRKYPASYPFSFISFKPKEPIEVLWWGVQKETTIIDKSGKEKEVIQLLVFDGKDKKFKIITTSARSLLEKLSEIEDENENEWNKGMASLIKITQIKEQRLDKRFTTRYEVEKLENVFREIMGRKEEIGMAEDIFLQGEEEAEEEPWVEVE